MNYMHFLWGWEHVSMQCVGVLWKTSIGQSMRIIFWHLVQIDRVFQFKRDGFGAAGRLFTVMKATVNRFERSCFAWLRVFQVVVSETVEICAV